MKDINKKKILLALKNTIDTHTFIKITLSAYCGTDPDLQKIIVRPVIIKEEEMLSFTYRYKTKDIVKNRNIYDGKKTIGDMVGKSFKAVMLFTVKEDISLTILDKTRSKLRQLPPSSTEKPTMAHDKQKQRYIDANSLFLKELGISNENGEIRTDKYDKYRQIDKFIETVDTLYKTSPLSKKTDIHIYDLGSGKSYLTFALYYFFSKLKQKKVLMTGVEMRTELVEESQKLADMCDFSGLHFSEGEISKTAVKQADIVVALHACDTATDDAIIKGIRSGAEIIVLAPCCHKYVRKSIAPIGILADLLREGIHMQREADIVTDSLRAMVLEYFGYKTQVFEFISSEHTSKNVMITAVKKEEEKDPEVLRKINEIKALFGLTDFYLDKQLSLT